MRHAILGPGGVGGLIGAVLAHAGENVTLIARPESLPQHPTRLSLDSPFGKFTVPVSVAAGLSAAIDILWITVKATQLNSAVQSITPQAEIGSVVPLLNGIDHIRILRERFGHACLVPATVGVESERTAPGVIVQRSPWVRLNVSTSGRLRLDGSFDHFKRFGFECSFVDDEATLLWSKLAFLAPIALSTTAAAAPIGEVLGNASRKARFEACVREACDVGNASGARLDANMILANIAKLPPQMRSSMQKDVVAERTPELDAIAGPILRGGTEHGLEVSATRALVNEILERLGEKSRAQS
jgi:2-dehydropantoate 2-reductase